MEPAKQKVQQQTQQRRRALASLAWTVMLMARLAWA
jgi:hypothetical protein